MEEPIIDNFSYHYPPELLAVLTETIPTLVKSKPLLLSFFRNAGVSASILEPYEDIIGADGRGHFLSSYDGNENEITIDDETFYIYRLN